MKKHTTLPLTALAVALALTGCGNDDTSADHDTMEPDTNLSDNTNPYPGGEILGDDTVTDYSMDYHPVEDGLDHLMDDSLMDDAHYDEHLEFGIPLDEMLENAYVHDTDGNLNDGENAKHDDFIHYEKNS